VGTILTPLRTILPPFGKILPPFGKILPPFWRIGTLFFCPKAWDIFFSLGDSTHPLFFPAVKFVLCHEYHCSY
jgi:hypothetical protein